MFDALSAARAGAAVAAPPAPLLVLGFGGGLTGDDGVGPLAATRLAAGPVAGGARVLSGARGDPALFPQIAAAGALVVIDAMPLGARPGAITVLEGAAMDEALASARGPAARGLAEIMAAARALGGPPERRACLAVEPGRGLSGLGPSAPVAAALPALCATVGAFVERWSL